MKKLFSLIIALVFVVSLSACGADGSDISETETLEDRINNLEDTVSNQRERITEMENVISSMETTINEEKVVFTVDTGERTLARTAPYSESSDLNAFELMDLVYELDYTESDNGVYLEGIESLNVPEGSYIPISKNGEMIETGLSNVAFEGGDHFHFELSWWDENLKAVNDSVELFVDNHAETFLESGDHLVALGMHHLGQETMLESLSVPTLGDAPTDGELIQHIFISEVLDEEASDDRAALADQASTDYAYSAALSYLALATGDIGNHGGYAQDFEAVLDGLTVSETDNDSLSMVLLALTAMDDSAYDGLENDIVTHLENNAYENTYGDNAAGFASMITALVAAGENPASDTFEEGGSDLVEHLLSYQTDEGAFLYQSGDGEADMAFSTPQAFFALAAYQASLNDEAFTHPFRLD